LPRLIVIGMDAYVGMGMKFVRRAGNMRGLIHNCCGDKVSIRVDRRKIKCVLLRPVALLSAMVR